MSADGTARRAALDQAAAYAGSWLEFRQRYLRVPGVQAAIVHDGRLLLSAAYGLADVEARIPLTPDSLFRVASHSKTFTATAILQLVEAGRLRLDDPLGAWVDFLGGEDRPAIASVTVREVLAHSGGLVRDGYHADFWQLRAPFLDRDQLREVALDHADVLGRNERFKYSNIGYALLGEVIEAASGRAYHEFVTTEIVERLGLTRTGPELDEDRLTEYATGYSALAYADARVPLPHADTAAMASATGFYSTARDLCDYFTAHLPGDQRLISDAGKRILQHQQWDVEGDDEGGYGLGFAVQPRNGRRLIGHGGGFPGHITRTLFDPDERYVVSVLSNAIDGPAEALALGVAAIIDLALTQDPDPARADLSRFTGRLANVWGVQDVALLGGRLLILAPAGDSVTATATLAVEDETTLRVVAGRGYGSVGEAMRFTFDGDRIVSVSGPGGQPWWPLSDYRPPGG